MFRATRLSRTLRPLANRPIIQRSPVLARCQSDAAAARKPAGSMERASVTLNRFWKTVGVTENNGKPLICIAKRLDELTTNLSAGILAVTLDGRSLRTPEGAKLEIPKSHRLLAALIATEWENQEKLIKPHALPMTSIASRAIDGLKDEGARVDLAASLLKYLDTDTICFQESHPPALVKLQDLHWAPLLDWARETYSAEINVFDSILGNTQPPETKAIFAAEIDNLDQWEMAAFERAVFTTKSFIIALALLKGRIGLEQASQAAHVEVSSQIERWGEVEDTHDVDYHDVRRQLGSVVCVLATN